MLFFFFSLPDTPDQMIIVWNTVNDTRDSRVIYGKGTQIDKKASGIRYLFVDGGPEQRSQFVHKVILTELAPETEYCKCCILNQTVSCEVFLQDYKHNFNQ